MSAPRIIVELSADQLGAHSIDGCRQCSNQTGYLARYIHTNGTVGLRWVCTWCEDYRSTPDLPHALLGDTPLDRIPIRLDNSDTPTVFPDCAICGEPAAEYHHWAPRSIFPDWPDQGIHLCKAHHDEWHKRMRTHGLRWPHELE